jgi:hypothetical protein
VAFSSLPGLLYSSCDNSGSVPPQCRGVRYGEVIHAPGAKTLLGFSVCVFLGGRGGGNVSKAVLIVKRVTLFFLISANLCTLDFTNYLCTNKK